MNRQKLIYIASPYTGWEASGVKTQMVPLHKIMDMGHLAYAPLLCHFAEIHEVRHYNDWLQHGLAMVARCDVLLRLGGISKGADLEVEEATKHGIPVRYSLLTIKPFRRTKKLSD